MKRIDTRLTDYIAMGEAFELSPFQKTAQKSKGQFFTPPSIARFMANQITLHDSVVSLLDPGAGSGILTAAVCERLLAEEAPFQIDVHLFENDPDILPVLKESIAHIKSVFQETHHSLTYEISSDDFIETHACFFDEQNLFGATPRHPQYDVIISNPPYFKLSKIDHQSYLMRQIVHGQPNIYMFFMALSAALLKEHGQMVFITPRSYCSGLYFKRFRNWFLQQIRPVFFHLFESRSKTFKQQVLQETVILKAVKQAESPSYITISTSEDAELQHLHTIYPAYDTVIRSAGDDSMIHLPSNELDLEIVDIIRSWYDTFFDLGFRISTGPVVSFRATQYLTEKKSYDGVHRVPLLWMNHLQDFSVQFPVVPFKKPQTMLKTEASSKLLIKNQYYVLVKRFSSKEQKRRLYASYYSPKLLDHTDYFGLENHVNYIWKPVKGLSQEESLGIMALLNSSLFDRYFRVMNGHTQVNASEILHMPFPSYEAIIEIGETIKYQNCSPKKFDAMQIDTTVMNFLHIPQRIQDALS
ncbi:N-6 DNA methylase [candidate division KSB3 bacterium]|uniref:site-specific DNA-methyltransferase (adenine-specific) n=1 Tax=candidate division KSB3 bacterium TaxID=2044937 RepID=A0A9D5JWK4_9BACT|nr:N-6 DNA methylase [candidate division KSB3 bacterium]MBD3325474.1 N-6 DNA methylase [candidate division KSB3 bacterium]